jgi:RNA polymerase sigma-70 factor (ECF subfamily)
VPRENQTLFHTTRWTLVGDAARSGDEEAREAFGQLFRIYWRPLYRFVCRSGKSGPDAEDLVQGFFAHLLGGDGLRLADRDRGRFRAFMLGALKNYMANVWRREHRAKRGGFSPHLPMDLPGGEAAAALEMRDGRSPDLEFDREWAMALLGKVLADLELEEPDFGKWEPFLSLDRGQLSYADMASRFGMSEGAARVAVHRLRKRYRQRVRAEIARTLVDDSMVDDEMKSLFSALAGETL